MTELEQQAATIQSVGADGVELTTIYPLEV
jgi:hypothetical protein